MARNSHFLATATVFFSFFNSLPISQRADSRHHLCGRFIALSLYLSRRGGERRFYLGLNGYWGCLVDPWGPLVWLSQPLAFSPSLSRTCYIEWKLFHPIAPKPCFTMTGRQVTGEAKTLEQRDFDGTVDRSNTLRSTELKVQCSSFKIE